MRDSATPEELRTAAEWMRTEIARHCDKHANCRPPKWFAGDDAA